MTVVEWLLNELEKGNFEQQQKAIKQALEMEKQQIIDAYRDSRYSLISKEDAEQYYKEKFNK